MLNSIGCPTVTPIPLYDVDVPIIVCGPNAAELQISQILAALIQVIMPTIEIPISGDIISAQVRNRSTTQDLVVDLRLHSVPIANMSRFRAAMRDSFLNETTTILRQSNATFSLVHLRVNSSLSFLAPSAPLSSTLTTKVSTNNPATSTPFHSTTSSMDATSSSTIIFNETTTAAPVSTVSSNSASTFGTTIVYVAVVVIGMIVLIVAGISIFASIRARRRRRILVLGDNRLPPEEPVIQISILSAFYD